MARTDKRDREERINIRTVCSKEREVMPLCDYEGYIEFRPDGIHDVSLHEYEEIDVIENVTVQILKCKACGKISIGYWRGGIEDRPGEQK